MLINQVGVGFFILFFLFIIFKFEILKYKIKPIDYDCYFFIHIYISVCVHAIIFSSRVGLVDPSFDVT